MNFKITAAVYKIKYDLHGAGDEVDLFYHINLIHPLNVDVSIIFPLIDYSIIFFPTQMQRAITANHKQINIICNCTKVVKFMMLTSKMMHHVAW